MCKPHKHAAIIKAWADGAVVQYRSLVHDWQDCSTKAGPWWDHETAEFRIKPEPKPDVVGYIRALRPVGLSEEKEWSFCSPSKAGSDNIKCTFDGETGKLKKVELISNYMRL